MAYPTLSALKSILKITDTSADVALQLALDSATSWVEDFTGRNWSATPVVLVDEQYDLENLTQTSDGMFIMLRQMDVVSIQAVKLGDQTLAAADYKWDDAGRIVIFGRVFDIARRAFNDYQYVKISYTYGATTPKAIEGATVMLAMAFWNDQLALSDSTAASGLGSESSADSIKSERIGEYQVTRGGGSQSAADGASSLAGGTANSTGTINSVSRMLNSYRKRRV